MAAPQVLSKSNDTKPHSDESKMMGQRFTLDDISDDVIIYIFDLAIVCHETIINLKHTCKLFNKLFNKTIEKTIEIRPKKKKIEKAMMPASPPPPLPSMGFPPPPVPLPANGNGNGNMKAAPLPGIAPVAPMVPMPGAAPPPLPNYLALSGMLDSDSDGDMTYYLDDDWQECIDVTNENNNNDNNNKNGMKYKKIRIMHPTMSKIWKRIVLSYWPSFMKHDLALKVYCRKINQRWDLFFQLRFHTLKKYVKKNKIIYPNCKGNHNLRKFEIIKDDWINCDLCESSLEMGTYAYGCRICDYDLCQSCYDKQTKVNDVKHGSRQFIEGCKHQLKDYSKITSKLLNEKNENKIQDIEDSMLNIDVSDKAMKGDINKVLFENGFEFTFECPLLTSELRENTWDDTKAYCQACHKNVSLVNNLKDFNNSINQGNCVSFDPTKVFQPKFPRFNYPMGRLGGVIVRRG